MKTQPDYLAEIAALEAAIAPFERRLARIRASLSQIRHHTLKFVPGDPEERLIQTVNARVAEHYGVLPESLLGRDRHVNIALARQTAIYLCRALAPEISSNRLGDAYQRNHATILWSVRVVQEFLNVYPAYAQIVADLRSQLAEKVANLRPKQNLAG